LSLERAPRCARGRWCGGRPPHPGTRCSRGAGPGRLARVRERSGSRPPASAPPPPASPPSLRVPRAPARPLLGPAGW